MAPGTSDTPTSLPHNDADVYRQGVPRPHKGSSFTTAVLSTHTFQAVHDVRSASNFSTDLDGILLWVSSAIGHTFLLNSCGMMLVDSSATHCFGRRANPRVVAGPEEGLPTLLDVRKGIDCCRR